jgi:hypothetical protein
MSSIGLKALVFSNHEIYDKVLSEPLALDQKKVKRIAECQLILHPAALKYAYDFLGERLKEYEAYYGEISTGEEFESRKKKYMQSKSPNDLESKIIFFLANSYQQN